MQLEYSWKEKDTDSSVGREGSQSDGLCSYLGNYDYATAREFDGFFNVSVMGDTKGAINLVRKSPVPWNDKSMNEWNYLEDKKGNTITDPSQLSISFAKATGVFTGKASVYFDYELPPNHTMKHTTVTLPYSGVMLREEYDGEVSYTGFGSVVYNYKYTEMIADGNKCKAQTSTKKVTLPVLIATE